MKMKARSKKSTTMRRDCSVSEKSEYSGLRMNITVDNEEKGKYMKTETNENFLSERLDKVEKKISYHRIEMRILRKV